MHVLHVIYDDPGNPWVGGGGAVRLRQIYKRLSQEMSVTIVTGNYPGARDEIVDGITYVRVGSSGPYAWSRLTFAMAASRMLRSADYNAGMFDFSAYSPVSIPRTRRVGVMLGQLVGGSSGARWGKIPGKILQAYERSRLRNARAVCAVSRALAQEAEAFLGDSRAVAVVGAGVDDRYFDVRRQEPRFFLFLGRFDVFQKGLDTLISAMAELRDRGTPAALRIIGRGRDEAVVRQMVAARGLDESVEVIVDPPFDIIADAMAESFAMVAPSRFEGFGMVAAEAMAAGVPVIGSGIPAFREVVEPPRGGILVPVDDHRAFADAMQRLVEDAETRDKISTSARDAARRFSWAAVAAAHSRFIQAVAALPL